MYYKKYALGLIGSLLSMWMLVWGLAWGFPLSRYLNDDYPYIQQQKDHVMKDDCNVREIILLGDSRTKMDILANQLGDNVQNLALSGASTIEMYYTLENYLQHHEKPKAIILSFAPEHYVDIGTYPAGSAYLQYFTKSELDEINQVLLKDDGKDFRKDTFCYYYRLPNVYMMPILKSVVSPRTKRYNELYDDAEQLQGYMRNKHEHQMSVVMPPETKENGFVPDRAVDYYMKQIIELAQKNDIDMFIEQTPMGVDGYEYLTANGYLHAYKEYMNQIRNDYGIAVNDEIPCYDNQYFSDDSHLNSKGAEVFTEYLKGKYKNLFLQDENVRH